MNISEKDILHALRRARGSRLNITDGMTRASILIPLITGPEGIDILLTLRTDLVEHHKNQISFPGGAADPGDRSPSHTALRETYEELGIPAESIEIIGSLNDVSTPSRFLITPHVGILRNFPPLEINIFEVREVFTVPLAFFLNPANVRRELRHADGSHREVFFFYYEEKIIWGVTANILRDLTKTILTFKNP